MKNTPKTTLFNQVKSLSITLPLIGLASCANQNTIAQQQLEPVKNPCQKIEFLINAYESNFDQLKENQIKARASNIWQAKYNLIGNSCKVWSWGTGQTTYSCNTREVDEASAKSYYEKAKSTLQQCLGEKWQLTESKRKHDDGLKAEYSTQSKGMTISTHVVPNDGLFQSQWSVYYYFGKTN